MARVSIAGQEERKERESIDRGCVGGTGMQDQKGGRGANDFMSSLLLLSRPLLSGLWHQNRLGKTRRSTGGELDSLVRLDPQFHGTVQQKWAIPRMQVAVGVVERGD